MPVQYDKKKTLCKNPKNITLRETKVTSQKQKNGNFCKLRDITLVSYKELYNQS